ncbi:MAG: hypothetical protein AB2705_17040 [Candidatus Thiodiazotropha sp.]
MFVLNPGDDARVVLYGKLIAELVARRLWDRIPAMAIAPLPDTHGIVTRTDGMICPDQVSETGC